MEEDNSEILLNRIKTPDGTILTSYSTHDYVTHVDKNGYEYMVDGGTSYLRRNIYEDAPYEEMSVYSNESIEIIRENVEWGTYGKDGKSSLRYIKIKDMETEHIRAILSNHYCSPKFREMFYRELDYRSSILKKGE